MKVLLITPPVVEPNAAYPATAYLTGYLRSLGYRCIQQDIGLEFLLNVFSRDGLIEVRNAMLKCSAPKRKAFTEPVKFFLANFEHYWSCVEPTIRFLQGRDMSIALKIVRDGYYPASPRSVWKWAFERASASEILGQSYEDEARNCDPLQYWFGNLGVQDRARYLASHFLEELAAIINQSVDHGFELRGFGDRLGRESRTFDDFERKLSSKPTVIDEVLDKLVERSLQDHAPDVVGITIPFAGAAYGAFRTAMTIKKLAPKVKIVLGGGYVNCCLRKMTDARVFKYVDFVCLDDGEKPFQCVLEHIAGKRSVTDLLRTFRLEGKKVSYVTTPKEHDVPHKDTPAPVYDGIRTSNSYLSLQPTLDLFERLEKNGHHNKITLAHGCYWRKCAFCDVSFDYIGRYETAPALKLVDKIAAIIAETDCRNFHFVDEAAPPITLRALSHLLIERKIQISWRCLVRWDRAFTPDLTALMARAGCVGVSGGIEVPSDRVLKLINKGTTIEQIAQVTKNFRDSGILTMAFMMFGFPTQTKQEVIDSLEFARQLFKEGCLTSAAWNRFHVTAGSPVAADPEKYGIRVLEGGELTFAEYLRKHHDPRNAMYDRLEPGLLKAMRFFKNGSGLDREVRSWFDRKERFEAPAFDPAMVRGFIMKGQDAHPSHHAAHQ